MTTPRIDINIAKIAHNAKELKEIYGSKDVGVIGVTKVNPLFLFGRLVIIYFSCILTSIRQDEI